MKNIILALDEIQDLEQALSLVRRVGHLVYAVKIHNLYDKFGPDVVRRLKEGGADKVWVDFKIYDIPNTAKLRAGAIEGDIISVHASGGVKMMQEAVSSGKEIFAVTILTSFGESEVNSIYNRELNEAVLTLASMAKEAGVAGVVCSTEELNLLKNHPELNDLKFVVPGLRSAGIDKGDQERVNTPAEALKRGADYLVIGRQITTADDPVRALENILKEIES